MKALYWFTGQAGAGKTELAKCLLSHLTQKYPNQRFVILDGDDIREMYQDKDYSIQGRQKNIEFVQKLCVFLIKNNIVPIVSMVSPFAYQRASFIAKNEGVEIYVYCNEIRGRENYHVAYYERPIHSPAIEINTTKKTVKQSFNFLLKQLDKTE